ncbi:MAG: molybdopterin-dependent oxidoreductase, partial [Actinobacteria bacterium]|nr:molybdopterin-dependent oxidoreductase [Actinomycetota bacterium]NIS29827.1 molybdopterin-dependent oxidoreductase [Actinomycetota bacterium]NIT94730.1 molybdopterin-dependent oxidoreductase [Actinomycetota bacterium]NIU18366.1 molybdopterin-dependent oxidoreductase [Actinomycetota bacterium]NIU65127.1 molybdopterin-dependent oxidoreductase [Actinomycetota bacterium]
VLGVPLDDIVVYAADTDMTPFDTGAYASSTTYISGMAVKRAAEEARRQIVERAALMLDEVPGGIELRDRGAWSTDGRSVTLAEIALHSLHQADQHQIMGTASYV